MRGSDEEAEGAAGVKEAGFHGADGDVGDAGDVFEGEIFEDVEEEGGALVGGETLDEGEECIGIFLTQELGERSEGGVVGERVVVGSRFGKMLFGAAGAAPVLAAFLVSDAEKPRGEPRVVAQRSEVADGGGEGFLDEIESGGGIAGELGEVGVERELVGFEKLIPRVVIVGAGGSDEMWINGGHRRGCLSGMRARAKGSNYPEKSR